MLRAALVSLALTLVLAGTSTAWAQEPPPELEDGDLPQAITTKLTPSWDQDTGAFGFALEAKIDRYLGDLTPDAGKWGGCGAIQGEATGTQTFDEEAQDMMEGSLWIGYGGCAPVAPGEVNNLVILGTVDLRGKRGTFEEGEGEARHQVEGTQYLGGVGAVLTWKALDVEALYYQVLDSSGTISVPANLEVDHVRVRGMFSHTFGPEKGVLTANGFDLDLRVSIPTTGADSGEAQFRGIATLRTKFLGKVPLAARFETGEEPAFEFDRKLFLGVLLGLD
jgi:hypothetical protein